MKIISKEDFKNFANDLIENDPRQVEGVQSKDSKFVFDSLDSAEDLRLDYDVTVLPPKKYFMPPRETIIKYKKFDGDFSVSSVVDSEPRILIGIHPYDLIAIEQMDKVFSSIYKDDYYLEKREDSILIGVNMQDVSEWSFAASMGTETTDSGYDLMLTDLGDKYAVEIGSVKGSKLLEDTKTRDATSEEVNKVEEIKEKLPEKFEKELNFSPEKLPTLLEEKHDDMEFWEEHSENCYSCGSCNLVCPTCYCFDIEDINPFGTEGGHRERRWDGCLLEQFAAVAAGENFRENRAERYRHRYMRKGKYIYDRFGDIACVGCGRCGSQCVPDIANPCRIYNQLADGQASSETESESVLAERKETFP